MLSNNDIKNILKNETLMIATFHKNGTITARKKFKSLAGRTPKIYSNKILNVIPNAKIHEEKVKNNNIIEINFSINK
jgi:hypothetical protein